MDKTEALKKLSSLPGLSAVLLNNPYYVLGIASEGTMADAKKAIEQIEKLEALNLAEKYKGQIEFPRLEKPERSRAVFQTLLNSLGDPKYAWLWFSQKALKSGNDGDDPFRDFTLSFTSTTPIANYENFVMAYLKLLYDDPGVNDPAAWGALLRNIDYFLSLPKEALKKIFSEHLSLTFRDLSFDALFTSFKEALLQPIRETFATFSFQKFSEVLPSFQWNRQPCSAYQETKSIIYTYLTRATDKELGYLSFLHQKIYRFPEKLPDEDAQSAVEALEHFETLYFNPYKRIVSSFQKDDPYMEAFSKKIWEPVNYLRVDIYKNDASHSAHFYSLIFPFISADLKEEWFRKNTIFEGYKPETLDLPFEYFTYEELLHRAYCLKEQHSLENTEKMLAIYKYLSSQHQIGGLFGLLEQYIEVSNPKAAEKGLDITCRIFRMNQLLYGYTDRARMLGLLLMADLKGLEGAAGYLEEFFPYEKIERDLTQEEYLKKAGEALHTKDIMRRARLFYYAYRAGSTKEAFTYMAAAYKPYDVRNGFDGCYGIPGNPSLSQEYKAKALAR